MYQQALTLNNRHWDMKSFISQENLAFGKIVYNINKIINYCYDFSKIEKKAHSNPPNWEFQTVCHDSDWQGDLCLWNLGPQLVLEGVL